MEKTTSPSAKTPAAAFRPGDHVWHVGLGLEGRIVDGRSVWGQTFYDVWLPERNTVVRARGAELALSESIERASADQIAYVAAAARVAEALAEDVLLAPLAASVIPLPHQVRALTRATTSDRVRYLLADEVGLGKTIEAGLILRELKLRGLARRILVVAPKGLVSQWIAELRLHFGEELRLLLPEDLAALRRLGPTTGAGDAASISPWRLFDQVICPLDSVKPLETRRGWSREQIATYNRERFEELVGAGWDLVIVDEAHRLAGSTDQVARYKLGQGLAGAAPYLLLLSATPHQGKTDAFHRLLALLDADAFPDQASVTRERIRPYVIRTEKRQAIDARGQPLFVPRHTQLVPVDWEARHATQQQLYDAVSDYVRDGYNQAVREKRPYLGFLLILMQRLVTSSTRAIRSALERRLDVLQQPGELLTGEPTILDDDWDDRDGQEQVDALLAVRLAALANERDDVSRLLELARTAEANGPDAKAEALLGWIYRLQRDEVDPDLKVLIFTEFVPTQEMLRDFFAERGFPTVCLNGSLDVDARRQVQEAFARDAQILVSTDAGGEGLNLQFCHVIVNYDIPWNPMRLEQRIGRVDRIGQTRPVRAFNFVLGETVEHRVQDVLEQKLAVILKEFGVDKTGDILDSAQASQIFDDLHRASVVDPTAIDARIDAVVEQVRDGARAEREAALLLADASTLEPTDAQRVLDHPLPHWVERMTVSFLRARRGQAERVGSRWSLTWPDGATVTDVVFATKDLDDAPTARQLTLEDERVRALMTRLPSVSATQAIPWLGVPELPASVRGFWSLWRITVRAIDRDRQRIMPLFVHDNGRIFGPTARRIWDVLLAATIEPTSFLRGAEAARVFENTSALAETQGREIYDGLVAEHRSWLRQEAAKAEYAFAARLRVIDRIGLPAVRAHRLAALDNERRGWQQRHDERLTTSPDLEPLVLAHVDGGGAGG